MSSRNRRAETRPLKVRGIKARLRKAPPLTEYVRLLREVLGRDPAEAPLIPPRLFGKKPPRTIEDIEPADDAEAGARVGRSDWGTLGRQERIGVMRAYLANRAPVAPPAEAVPPEPLRVTAEEVAWIVRGTDGRSVKTMRHRGLFPKAVGRRGHADLYRWSELVPKWPSDWSPLPTEDEARRMLATRPKESS